MSRLFSHNLDINLKIIQFSRQNYRGENILINFESPQYIRIKSILKMKRYFLNEFYIFDAKYILN
jgi:hypothetical protein